MGRAAHMPLLSGLSESSKMAPAIPSTSNIEGACKNGDCQCFVRVKCTNRLLPSHMVWALLKLLLFVLGPKASDSARRNFNSGVFIPNRPIMFLNMSPIGFQCQKFHWLLLPLKNIKDGVPDVG